MDTDLNDAKVNIFWGKQNKWWSFDNDLELAREIISREKRVDILELKIDGDVEEYIALSTPKAIDLRLVVSLKKINFALERIGDYAEGVARYVLDNDAESIRRNGK